MSKMQAFFAHNAKKPGNIKLAISKSFVDEEGQPLEWEFSPVHPDLDEKLKQQCTVKKMITQGKRKGQYDTDFLAAKYQNLLAVNSIVFPNLNDKELQDSYGVHTDEEVFKAMLLNGEIIDAIKASQEANGFEIDIDDLIEEAKN